MNGNLTVDNVYVSLSKIHRLLAELPEHDPKSEAEVERRYSSEDFSIKGRVMPRATEQSIGDLKGRVQRIKAEETVFKALPGLNCGLCGAPTCETFAKDVAAGSARKRECVFLSDKQLKRLRKTYLRRERRSPEGEL